LYENKDLTHNKEYTEKIYPSIISIKCINPKNLKIITNNNYWYTIKISHHDKNIHIEESNINEIENNSSKYAPSYPICLNNTPFIIYNKERNIIKGGFWDSHIEISTLINYEKKEKEKDKDKEEQISKTIFTPYYGPIVLMKMTKDEKLLFCGTNFGNIIIFDVKGTDLKINKVLFTHNNTITSISINENLNMFASSSIDGYINIYILPSFSIVRSIAISKKVKCDINDYDYKEQKGNEFLYADNIFLSSTPLPCLTIYILNKRIFKSYSINGEFISQVEEENDAGNLKNPLMFQNLNFHDFLIYGTDDGYVKIRSFPGMKLISSIKPFEGQEIKALELSPDNRFCFIWSHKDKIAVIKDSNTSTGFEIKEINGENDDNEQKEENINEINNSE
jgi:WD40 repeat protein